MALISGLLIAGVLELTLGSYLRDRARRIKRETKQTKKEKR